MPMVGGRMMVIGAAVVSAIVAATALAARHDTAPAQTEMTWRETAWQMPLDNWGTGRAWLATAADGAELRLFARTKSGFCNCYNGVANDDEIDRIGDVDLHGDNFSPLAPGQVRLIGTLAGRERMFQTTGLLAPSRYVLSMVAAEDCKAVVATIVSNKPVPPDAEARALVLLNGGDFRQWAANQQ